MKQRGKPSAASLEVIPFNKKLLERVERPQPPEELTREQADEWQAVVNRLPADWFPRETRPLLVEYCRHVVMARRVAGMIEDVMQGETLNLDQLNQLNIMADRESRAISALATKMRLTQHATYDKSKKKPNLTKNPWD